MAIWQRGLLGTLAILGVAYALGVTDGFNRWLTDAHWCWNARWRRPDFPKDILVIAIDDKTVNRLGRLRYWSRRHYAVLLRRLKGAKAVGIDILLSEPDERDPGGDKALARAMREQGRVVLPFHIWKEPRPFSEGFDRSIRDLLNRFPRFSFLFSSPLPLTFAHSLQPPAPLFSGAAKGLGFAEVTTDPDGVCRAPVLLRMTENGVVLPHFSVAVACVALGKELSQVLREGGKALDLNGRVVPLIGGALWLCPIARRGETVTGLGSPVPTVSFVDALKMPPERFDGKVILVGETATGTTDIRPTPLDNRLRGVELNAEILANLLHLSPVRPLPLIMTVLLTSLAIGLPVWLYSVMTARRAFFGSLLTLFFLVSVLEVAFWWGRFVPSWTPVLLGFLGATSLMALQRFAQEEAQKRKLRQSFSLYVAPELVEAIIRDPKITHQEGTRQRVAVLFSDVRDFTAYSERHPPELVVRQMREYLTEMTEAIDRYRGVLDKFIGDAVMALFGPFLRGEYNLSALAILSALEMLRRLQRLNERWQREGIPTFRIGIGIHVGEAVVGNIGSPRRMQYTALGDTVNLAARLQALTKEVKAPLLVSEAVREEAEPALGEIVDFIDRGFMPIKGKEQPVRVYEVRRKKGREVSIDAAQSFFQTEDRR